MLQAVHRCCSLFVFDEIVSGGMSLVFTHPDPSQGWLLHISHCETPFCFLSGNRTTCISVTIFKGENAVFGLGSIFSWWFEFPFASQPLFWCPKNVRIFHSEGLRNVWLKLVSTVHAFYSDAMSAVHIYMFAWTVLSLSAGVYKWFDGRSQF